MTWSTAAPKTWRSRVTSNTSAGGRCPILLTTGFSDVIVDEAGDGQAVDFGVLRKPYRKADLARAMRGALAV